MTCEHCLHVLSSSLCGFISSVSQSPSSSCLYHMTEEALVVVTKDNAIFILSAVSLSLRWFCCHWWLMLWDTISLCCPFRLLVSYCLWLISRPRGISPFHRAWGYVPFSVHTLWFWDKVSLYRLARNSWSSCPRFLSTRITGVPHHRSICNLVLCDL